MKHTTVSCVLLDQSLKPLVFIIELRYLIGAMLIQEGAQ